MVEHQSWHGGDAGKCDGGGEGDKRERERKEMSTYDVRLQQQVGSRSMKRRGDRQLETHVRKSRARVGV